MVQLLINAKVLLANIHLSLPRGNIKKHTSKPTKRQYLRIHLALPRGNIHTYIRAYQEAMSIHTYIRAYQKAISEYSGAIMHTYPKAYQEVKSKYTIWAHYRAV